MLLAKFLVIIFFQVCVGFKLPGFSSIFDIDGYYELTKEIVSKAQFAADRGENINFFDDRCEVMLGEMLDKVDAISEKLDVINDRIMRRLDGLESLIRSVADDVHKKKLFSQIVFAMKIVKEKQKTLASYKIKGKIPKRRKLSFFTEVVSSRKDGLEEQLRIIHRLIVSISHTSSFEETLLDAWENTLNAKNLERCNENTPQHMVYSLYMTVVAIELIGFTTIVNSAKLLELETNNDETDILIEMWTEASFERMKGYVLSFLPSIKNVERTFRTCDPNKDNHVRDVTFTEMWGLSQGIVMNEYGLVHLKSCSDTCGKAWVNRADDNNCYLRFNGTVGFGRYAPQDYDKCPTPRKCYGLVHDCIDLWSSFYCKLKNSTRRYEFIKDRYYNKHYAPWTPCENGVGTDFDSDGGDYFSSCTDCMCLCDDDEPRSLSVHTVSFMKSGSNSKDNKVVVGVRFKIEDRVLHLQVREGTIKTEFRINSTSLAWVDLPKIGQKLKPFGGQSELKEGRDYHSYKIGHAINLNNVVLDYNRVVTGVRFALSGRKETEDLVHVELQAESMLYNPATGKLIEGSEQWEKTSMIHKLTIEPKLPQNAKMMTTLKSERNQYMQLQPSDWEEDAAQTVLPLFDAQTVETKPPGPFGGIGLHYRSTYEEAGFIGLTGYSLDYGGFLEHSQESETTDPNDVLGPY